MESLCGSTQWPFLGNGTVDFSVCFENVAIVTAPPAFLVLACISTHLLVHSGRQPLRFTSLSRIHLVKRTLNNTLVCLILGQFLYEISVSAEHHFLLASEALLLGALLAVCQLAWQQARGARSSGALTVFWLLTVLVDIVRARSFYYEHKTHSDPRLWPHIGLFIPRALLDLVLFALSAVQEPTSYIALIGDETDAQPCPEEQASFFSIISFWWMNPMMKLGFKRALTAEDLWSPHSEDEATCVSLTFARNWRREMEENTREGKSPSLARAFRRSFGGIFAIAGVFKLIQDALGFVSPLLLNYLISYVSAGNKEPSWHGYLYTAGLFFAAALQSIFVHQYYHRVMKTGVRIRTALMCAVYQKCLRLSSSARQSTTSGEITNLMSIDAQALMGLVYNAHILWSAPMQIGLAFFFLWRLLGPSTLSGLAVMIMMIPLNALLMRKSRAYQVVQMTQKDKRIKTMNEVLNGIKVIKFYAWELPFQDRIKQVRDGELSVLRSSSYLSAVSSFTWSIAPFLVSFVTFITYSVTGGKLDANKAFVAMSLFNLMQSPLTLLPSVIGEMVEAQVSVKRLLRFLLLPELRTGNVTRTGHAPSSRVSGDNSYFAQRPTSGDDSSSPSPHASFPTTRNSAECVVRCEDGCFAWSSDGPAILRNITVRFEVRSLIAVVGRVGSGKSSLLSAFIGEMEVLSGAVYIPSSVAYVPQQAWIRNATLRDNILFGKPFNSAKYQRVLRACALEPDLETLPGGDMTEIGEKGINLSGGQKQRVSLARAVYQDADLYLLDDPLSAVDAHVGKHIFNNVLGPQGLLCGKVRVLVTHALKFLPQTDAVLVMKNGVIAEQGTYNELLAAKGEFAQFVEEYQDESHEDLGDSGSPSPSSSPTTSAAAGASLLPTGSSDAAKSQSGGAGKGSSDAGTVLVQKERALEGSVRMHVYIAYLRAISWLVTWSLFLGYVLTYAVQVGANFWLSYWSQQNEKSAESARHKLPMYLGVYGTLGFASSAGTLFVSLLLSYGAIRATRKMHADMLYNVLHSPMSFFDTTPMGRILNRFSRDVYVIDETIPQSLRSFIATLMQVASTIIVISISTPIFMAAVVPLIAMYYFIQKYYIATSRQLNRLESVSRSPIYAHFSETLSGVPSIRAYAMEDVCLQENHRFVNLNVRANFPIRSSSRWLALRLEFLGNLIVFFAALFAVLEKGKIDPGVVGLSLSYAMSVTQTLSWMVRMSSQLETDIVAIERVHEYTSLPTEAPPITDRRPPPGWPDRGAVHFDHLSVRYRENLPFVIRDLCASIKGGEKIGICGRTGAGKSSLSLSLFRIIEAASGDVSIDGEKLSRLGLQDLRSRLTIMPQDPVLFSGTIRYNLDPFGMYTDDQLWDAVRMCHLSSHLEGLGGGLESKVAEGGENFSVGQRQLICLARAALRKTRVLVLDEATAAIDLETDDVIQKTIREVFRECTILTIAHRLNTILDSDRIMVLDKGKIVEFDTPANLIAARGVFYGMAKSAGVVA